MSENPSSWVRPYARTGGRTRPQIELPLEALVSSTAREGQYPPDSQMPQPAQPEHRTIIDLCRRATSLAEIAAKLRVPIGVARVLVADLAGTGQLLVHSTAAASGDERDPAFLRRVLGGLQRL